MRALMSISPTPHLREAIPFEPPLPSSKETEWIHLESNSHLPSVQAIIRRKIREREVRVLPMPGDRRRVRIIPVTE